MGEQQSWGRPSQPPHADGLQPRPSERKPPTFLWGILCLYLSVSHDHPVLLPQGPVPSLGYFLSEVLPSVELVASSPPCSPPHLQGCTASLAPSKSHEGPWGHQQNFLSPLLPRFRAPSCNCPSANLAPCPMPILVLFSRRALGSLSPHDILISTVAVIHTLV